MAAAYAALEGRTPKADKDQKELEVEDTDSPSSKKGSGGKKKKKDNDSQPLLDSVIAVSYGKEMAKAPIARAPNTEISAKDEEWRIGLDDVDPDLKRKLREVVNMPAVLHIDHGQFDLIGLKDIETLFDKLGKNEKGQVEIYKLEALLEVKIVPPFSVTEVETVFDPICGPRKSKDGYKQKFVFAQELLKALKSRSPAMETLMATRRKKEQLVTRDFFVSYVHNAVERDDALMTLPITIMYLMLFVYLIQKHLQIFDRRALENAMEEFINGRDPRETADENIDDMDSLWEWVTEAGLRGPLGNVKNSTDNRFKVCWLASRNVLIGDVRLSKRDFDGNEESVWLLNSAIGRAYLQSNPYEYQAAAVAAANNLKDNGWSSPDIEAMWMSFNSYNDMSKMFAITNVYVPLPRLGNVISRIDCAAVSIDPYPSADLYVADSLFLCLACYICFHELKDVIDACRLGFDEFKQYWTFWNLIDWFNIFFFVLFGLSWYATVMNMSDDSYNSLLSDYKIDVDVMQLDDVSCEKISSQLKSLRRCYWSVQITMALNTLFVVAKFFKSFNANARLRVVTDTFKQAGVDLIHFGIMFTTIFLPFTIVGHILFGSDIQEFSSITSSINLGIMCLMGDFGWYVEAAPAFFSSVLPSGMPKMVVMLWYVSFMFLVFLVLLNMLLAVILQHYTDVAEKMTWSNEAESIWDQAREYRNRCKETKGYIPLEKLRNALEDDDNMAHEDESVTIESLLNARWPNSDSGEKMSQAQASWLMTKLEQQNKQERDKEVIEAAEHAGPGAAKANGENLLGLASLTDKSRLEYLEAANAGFTSIGETLDSMSSVVGSLKSSVAKLRKEQDRLASRVDEIMQNSPDESRPINAETRLEVETTQSIALAEIATSKIAAEKLKKKNKEKSPGPTERSESEKVKREPRLKTFESSKSVEGSSSRTKKHKTVESSADAIDRTRTKDRRPSRSAPPQ